MRTERLIVVVQVYSPIESRGRLPELGINEAEDVALPSWLAVMPSVSVLVICVTAMPVLDETVDDNEDDTEEDKLSDNCRASSDEVANVVDDTGVNEVRVLLEVVDGEIPASTDVAVVVDVELGSEDGTATGQKLHSSRVSSQ